MKHVFPLLSREYAREGDMEGGRPVCAVIDERALNDFMFYIYHTPVFAV